MQNSFPILQQSISPFCFQLNPLSFAYSTLNTFLNLLIEAKNLRQWRYYIHTCTVGDLNILLVYLTYPSRLSAILRATYTPLADAWERECVTPLPSPMI